MPKKTKNSYKKLKKREYQDIYDTLIANLRISKKIKIMNRENKPIKLKFLDKSSRKNFMAQYGIKDPRRLNRILKMGFKSNGNIQKIKKSGKKCLHILDEIKICPHLKRMPGWGKFDFVKMKEKLQLTLSEKNSNGYLQNFKKRHLDCSSKICNLENKEKNLKNPSFQLSQSESFFSKQIDEMSSHLIENFASKNEKTYENGFNLPNFSLFYNETQFQEFDSENLYSFAPNKIEEVSSPTLNEQQNFDENSNFCSYRSFSEIELPQNENLSFLCYENNDDKFSFCESDIFHEKTFDQILKKLVLLKED